MDSMSTEYDPHHAQGGRLHSSHDTPDPASHFLSSNDPDNPMNWPLHRRVYASAVSWSFAFTVAFGLTSYTAGINDVIAEFNVSTTTAILGLSIYLFGIAFAPIYTPHLAERTGRSILYLISLFVFMLFILGSSQAKNISTLLACRFFAGLFGGPCLVLIEGTFADIWSAETTNTYYAFLGLASYIGAACGPIVGNFVVAARGWRWAEYITLMIALAVYLFGCGIPETYQREIPRRRARRQGLPAPRQPPAESGVTLSQMFRITVITPIVMLISEPIVILSSLVLLLNWGLIFQWFITVPVVLTTVYGLTPQQAGLAFTSAIAGSLLAATISISIEQALYRRAPNHKRNNLSLEYRLLPAIIGAPLIPASLFWIGWTAQPDTHFLVPVFGTMAYVTGNLLLLISIIPYLFDAYPPAGTLSALTAAACSRILIAGAFPLFILQMFTKLTGKWALATFGFISIPMVLVPVVLFFFGERFRKSSRYARRMSSDRGMEVEHENMPLHPVSGDAEQGGVPGM